MSDQLQEDHLMANEAKTPLSSSGENLKEGNNSVSEKSKETPASMEALTQVSDNNINEEDVTDVIVWALRKLASIEDRLDKHRVFDLVENWLLQQQSDLFLLLRKHPKQVKRELLAIQRQKEKKLRKYREQEKKEILKGVHQD